MSMRYVVVACLAMLAGCTTAKDVYLPDGTLGHHVSCDTFATGLAGCYQKAGEICEAKGYTIVDMAGGRSSSWGTCSSSARPDSRAALVVQRVLLQELQHRALAAPHQPGCA